MSDNQIINQSLSANNDWLFIVIIVLICIIALMSHVNSQRWVVSGGIRVCPKCVLKYKRAQRKGVRLGISYAPSQNDLPCDDCGR